MQKFNNSSIIENSLQGIPSYSSINSKSMKRKYFSPTILEIRLDNQIALQLASDPPTYESVNTGKTQDYFMQNPFKDMHG